MKWKLIILCFGILTLIVGGIVLLSSLKNEEIISDNENKFASEDVLSQQLGEDKMKLQKDYIENIRKENNTEVVGDIEKSFDSINKEIMIKNLSDEDIKKYKLLSDYEQYVSYGDDVWIAEIEVDLKLSKSDKLFSNIEFYNTNYNKTEKKLKYKYKTEWEDVLCTGKGKDKVCETELKVNWTEFTDISELPSKKEIIGIFINVSENEKGEWILIIDNIKIYEFAEFTAITSWDTNYALTTQGGMGSDSNWLWIADGGTDLVYRFFHNGTNGGLSFDSAYNYVNGIDSIGGYLWIMDGGAGTSDAVYKFFTNGTYTGSYWDISIGTYNVGMATNGTFFWTDDAGGDEVYKHWANGTYTGEHFDLLASGCGDSTGITTNNTFIWCIDDSDDQVYKFWINGTYTGLNFDTAGAGNTVPTGITNDGFFFYVTDSNDNVYVYDMNTALSPSATGEDYNQWTDPTDAYSSNEVYAYENTNTQKQDYYNFSFSIPAGATINGILVNAEAFAYSSSTTLEVELSWDGGTSYTSQNKQKTYLNLAEVYEIKAFGGNLDTWGRTWNSSEFSNANFRLRVEVIDNGGEAFYLDHIRVGVYYTEASSSSNCWGYDSATKMTSIPAGCLYKAGSL